MEVSAPQGKVWWKDFVYKRPLAKGRQQLIIHLINEPPTPNMDAKNQLLPAPVADIAVKFKGKIEKVWVASSEPQLHYRQVPVENGAVKVPELRIWTMVIVETEGK